ncbi:helix-turn-helix domain-containing protein [Streptomyces sp. NPDC050422]|uniref:helix-turn-helix domain-containing protein n=1 Tax=Streptomyces sp. NPDC050422 TaxID=3365614 RepID=UPI0037A552FB
MSGAATKLGVGTHFRLDGETVEVVEFASLATGMEVVLKDGRNRLARMSLRELLTSDRVELIHDRSGPSAADDEDVAAVVLSRLTKDEQKDVLKRTAHVREMLTGYRSGSEHLPQPNEPRPQYAAGLPLKARYEAKAVEMGVTERTVRRWARAFREFGEAGLVPKTAQSDGGLGNADPRWVEAAVEVLKEYERESRPSVKVVLEEVEARVKSTFKLVKVPVPPRTTAYRWMQELERRHPTFRLSTQRNRDIADRPRKVYGKLRPTRPGEYVLMDTTRLDVFALDPVTLRWMQAELTVAMDWYTRCIIGLRVTPVSTKAIDAAAVLYQAYRPQLVPESWPREAAWPEHGIPRGVLVEAEAVHGPVTGVWGPKVAPETLIVDHGKIYVSAHLTSVCRRMGISVQPARLRTGRDKGPVERFFRTLREDLLQRLPGYKGPDIHSRGLNPEKDAFFFHHELEAIIREWTAVTYHRRHAPSLNMPLSEEALQFARRLAAKEHTYPDDRLAIALLLKRWNLGLGTSLVERRMALRLSREQTALDLPGTPADDVRSLPSVARVLSLPEQLAPPPIETVQDREPEAGDDDADGLEELEEELDFYATALKDIDDDE